jgi:quinoprotein glucose dehydrogenase
MLIAWDGVRIFRAWIEGPQQFPGTAYDAKLDLVYLPMGVTTPDIWGGNRTPEQERYASSVS